MTPSQQLHEAIKKGDVAAVEALLDGQSRLANAGEDVRMPPLMLAVYYGRDEIAQLLLRHGAELTLFAAAALGRLDRVMEIVWQDPEAVYRFSPDGWTALHLAAFFGQQPVVEFLLRSSGDVHLRSENAMRNTPLHAAVANRHLAIAALLLEHGAEVNARQHGGFAPLHGAAASGDEAMVRLLLSRDADRDVRSDEGKTPAMVAAERGHAAIAALLRAG